MTSYDGPGVVLSPGEHVEGRTARRRKSRPPRRQAKATGTRCLLRRHKKRCLSSFLLDFPGVANTISNRRVFEGHRCCG